MQALHKIAVVNYYCLAFGTDPIGVELQLHKLEMLNDVLYKLANRPNELVKLLKLKKKL